MPNQRNDADEDIGLLIGTDSTDVSAFSNQGQIDWISLAKTSVTASVSLLSRLSSAGVDPFTVTVAHVVASRFRPSHLGLHRLQTALSQLHSFSGLADALWFGFGVKHVIRVLAQTNEGATCIILCAALAEMHSFHWSARVLAELTDLYSSPSAHKDMTPSLEQWLLMIRTCAGTLSATPFGTVFEQIMAYAGNERVSSKFDLRVGDPRDTALALRAVASLSQGHMRSITITGAGECAWVAAFAYWFFETDVEIRDSLGGTLYCTDVEAERKVIVVYDKAVRTGMEITGESYTIRQLSPELLDTDGLESARLSGRVDWNHALYKTFGERASALLEKEQIFGLAIGSAARMFRAIAYTEKQHELSIQHFIEWCSYGDSGFGRGYLESMVNWFPETETLMPIMERAVAVSFAEAAAAYEAAITRLIMVCSCRICDKSKPEVNGEEMHQVPFCVPVLCETIIRTVVSLSICRVHVPLDPSRAGLEQLYDEPLHRWLVQIRKMRMTPLVSLLHSLTYRRAAEDIALIFTGCTPNNDVERGNRTLKRCPAVVVRGVCLYSGILEGLPKEMSEGVKLHVLPGRIQSRSGRSFDRVADSIDKEEIGYPASLSSTVAAQLALEKSTLPSKMEVTLVAEETFHGLGAFLEISSVHGIAKVGIEQLATTIIRSIGVINCGRRTCRQVLPEDLLVGMVEGEGRLSVSTLGEDEHTVFVRCVGSDPAEKCLALFIHADPAAICRSLNSTGNVRRQQKQDPNGGQVSKDLDYLRKLYVLTILRRDECNACALRTAIELSGAGPRTYIV